MINKFIDKGLQTILTFRTTGKFIIYPLINAQLFEANEEGNISGDDAVNLTLHCFWLPQEINYFSQPYRLSLCPASIMKI